MKKKTFTIEEILKIIDEEIEKYNPDEPLGINNRGVLVNLKEAIKKQLN